MRWADERLRDPQELFIHGPEVVKITDAAGRVRLHRLQYGDGE